MSFNEQKSDIEGIIVKNLQEKDQQLRKFIEDKKLKIPIKIDEFLLIIINLKIIMNIIKRNTKKFLAKLKIQFQCLMIL